jgi:tRNA threonylcarbamoyl adenosine modification protein (Sua5/YciO/YrdC/YwlC family)
MRAELLRIYPENPEIKKINRVVEILRQGGVVIYPTDTVYGIGCDLMSKQGLGKLLKIKGLKAKSLNFSFLCTDLSQISEYTKPIPNQVFKTMKKCLPGPFTFLLPANSHLPKILDQSKRTVGVRVPDNNIVMTLVAHLGNPILSASIKDQDEIVEYTTDPSIICDDYGNLVDCIIDGGLGGNEPSTVVDCAQDDIILIREGAGDIDLLG